MAIKAFSEARLMHAVLFASAGSGAAVVWWTVVSGFWLS